MIERLYVQNFRCLESVALDFAGKSSALIIGKNGAGKSTTRQALAIFQRICRGPSRVDKLISPGDFAFGRTDRPMRFEIEVALTGKRFAYSVSFDWPDNFREARILDESLAVDGQVVFTRQQAQVDLASGSNFGLNWHVFALPVINERPPERSIQDLKAYLASLMLMAPVPGNRSARSGSSFRRCVRRPGGAGTSLQPAIILRRCENSPMRRLSFSPESLISTPLFRNF